MERDVSLRRVERTSVAVCGAMAGVALLASGGRPDAALGVLAGGLLAGVSYHTLKAAVSGLVDPMARGASTGAGDAARVPGRSWILVKVALRYALLALLAYVMIARLRLHPLGLLAGASSVVAAVSIEAIRLLFKKP